MNGVSCRAFGLVLDGVATRRIPIDELIVGLDITAEELANPQAQMSWDTCAEILDRLASKLGSPSALRTFAEEHYATESFQVFHLVGRLLSKPHDMYAIGAHWMGPSLFPMCRAELWETPDGRIVQRLTLADGHRDCPGFFHLIHGALIEGPRTWGHAASEIEMRLEPHRATYYISPAEVGQSLIGRLIRAFRAPFTLPRMFNELITQQVAIEDNYTEIRKARDQISDQAADLERVNSIGRRLAEHVEIDRVADVMVDVLLGDLGAAGMELWLIRPDHDRAEVDDNMPLEAEPKFFRRGGRQDRGTCSQFLLETASRPVGTLRVWHAPSSSKADPNQPTNDDLLVRLLPWIAMSLDNARSYEALQSHAVDLEQRVQERTTRLLSANHHLVKEIGERKKATEALIQSEAQLRASERLASIGTLAAGIAHEINNPIGSILASAQLAQVEQERGGFEAEVGAALTDIVSQAKRCGGIVRSVLQFSRDERTEKWDCEIQDILQRSVRLLSSSPDFSERVIHTEFPEQAVWGCVNPIQIEQAIVNLLRNAFESGADDIWMRATSPVGDSEIRITVSDNGSGIPSHEQHRIFEPFFTTKRTDGGTGLGLSVVHGIATEHGGMLSVDSTNASGTLATLSLPTIPAPPVPLNDKPDE